MMSMNYVTTITLQMLHDSNDTNCSKIFFSFPFGKLIFPLNFLFQIFSTFLFSVDFFVLLICFSFWFYKMRSFFADGKICLIKESENAMKIYLQLSVFFHIYFIPVPLETKSKKKKTPKWFILHTINFINI